jgi:hypothetical protein
MIHSKVTKEMIKPGHTLIVLGNYGTGKLQSVRQAIEEHKLAPYECEVVSSQSLHYMGIDNPSEPMVWSAQFYGYALSTFKDFTKSIYGNGVLIVQNIQRLHQQPMFAVTILEQMFNPDRAMVLIGSEFDCMPILLRSTIVKL